MKRIYLKRAMAITVVVTIIIGTFYLLQPKRDWIVGNMNHTVGENGVDVICIGSSHMFCGINPIKMYKDKGIAAYDLALGAQSPWQSYFYLKESLKTQNPKLVILDAYMLAKDLSYYKDSQTVNNLKDAPVSLNKISAVMASTAESRLSVILAFPYDRKISKPSFNKINSKKRLSLGYNFSNKVVPYEVDISDICNITEYDPIEKKNEYYVRKMIEYCTDRGIDVVLVNAPCPEITDDKMRRYNYVSMIADEYGIPFIEGCKLSAELKMDWQTDCKEDGHLNNSGVEKFTAYVEEYISAKYDLPDRRSDENYGVYEESVKWLDKKLEGQK